VPFSSIERSVIISSVIVVTLDQVCVVVTRLYPRTTMTARSGGLDPSSEIKFRRSP